MTPLERCPVCARAALRPIGRRRDEIIEPPPSIQQAGINAILRLVLGVERHETTTWLCAACRHVFLAPTFAEAELDRLYSPECVAETKRQYRESERATGVTWAAQHGLRPAEQQERARAARAYRPRRLREIIERAAAPGAIRTILDFGAQTGELTAAFPAPCARFVYDKNLEAVTDPGVRPLGSLAAVRAQGPYDLIVLSHVLEHVPQPVELLADLRATLAPGGLVYVEVPLEYCGALVKRRGIALGPHIHFYTRTSLLAGLRRAGLRPLAIRREVAPYGECQAAVWKAVARAEDNGARGPRPRPWPWDLLRDAAMIYSARKWRRRFR
jgi:SAM-dependent methyltransferase